MKKEIKLHLVFVLSVIAVSFAVVLTITPSAEEKNRSYVGYSEEECSRIQILCTPDREYFSDETGCGCELKEFGEERFFCSNESRTADFCIEIYQPVCGWFNPEKIQCIKFHCANTYSNSCFACMDENVLYYTEGVCPEK